MYYISIARQKLPIRAEKLDTSAEVLSKVSVESKVARAAARTLGHVTSSSSAST